MKATSRMKNFNFSAYILAAYTLAGYTSEAYIY